MAVISSIVHMTISQCRGTKRIASYLIRIMPLDDKLVTARPEKLVIP